MTAADSVNSFRKVLRKSTAVKVVVVLDINEQQFPKERSEVAGGLFHHMSGTQIW